MDIYPSLPAIDGIAHDSALETAQLIRGELRPYILDRLADFCSRKELTQRDQSRVLELETRIDEIDKYAMQLDQFIINECPPPPAQLREPALDVKKRKEYVYVEAVAELFFSAESLTNVHGPVMLFYLATLAEEILHPGEVITGLRKTAFKRLVVRQMRLYACDAAEGFPAPVAKLTESASVTGRFLLNSGRMLDFFGVQTPERPVIDIANFNSFAIKMMPKGLERTKVGDVYHMRLALRAADECIPPGGFTPASSLMTSLDFIMIMWLTLPYPYRTKLLLRIMELDVLPDPVNQLSNGVTVQILPHEDKKRRINDDFWLMPADFRFSPLEEKFKRVHIAIGDLPYYKVVTT